MAEPTVLSFDAHTLNSGGLFGFLSRGDLALMRQVESVSVRPDGRFPRLVRTEETARIVPVHVLIQSGTISTQMATLQQWFRTGTTGELLVDFDGTTRVLDATVLRTIPHDRGVPALFTAVLEVPDPRWRTETQTLDVTAITASGQTWTDTNDGTAQEDQAVARIKPTTLKAAANDWRYYDEIIIANRIDRVFSNYAVEITEGWNHAAEVTAARSLASGNDIRVLLDGVSVPWYSDNLNAAATKIWANLSLSPGLFATLNGATTAISPADGEDLPVDFGDTDGFPETGYVLYDDEVIRYSGKTRSAFTGITRAARRTTAAIHADATEGYWVERRVQLMYGHTGASAPENRPERKPMLDLVNSSNSSLVWADFAHETDPRSMQWARTLVSGRDSQSDRILAPTGAPAADMRLEYQEEGAESDKPNFNTWRFRFPSGLANGGGGNALSLTRSIADTLALKVYGRDAEGNEELLSEEGGPVASGTLNIAEPAAPIFEADLYGRSQVVEQNPAGALTANLSINNTLYDGTGQQFTAPADAACLGVILRLAVGGAATISMQVTLYSDNGADAPGVALSSEENTGSIVGPSSEAWYAFTWNTPVDLIAGQKYWLNLKQTGGGTNGQFLSFKAIYTRGIQLDSGVLQTAQVGRFRVLSVEGETLGAFATAENGEQVVMDAMTAALDSAKVPYVNMLARRDAYWLDGTLKSDTTSQELTFAVLCELNEEIEIDVGDRTVRNITTDESVLFGVTPTDEDRWLTLEPGVNTLRWTEPNLVAVTVDVDLFSRWE